MSVENNIDNKPRRRRVATFSFKGVVSAKTTESARIARTCMENICKTIIETYKAFMESDLSPEEKRVSLLKICSIESELLSLNKFIISETESCNNERIKINMTELRDRITEAIKRVIDDFALMREDSHLYQKMFDDLIQIIDDITKFFKEGLNLEQERMLTLAYDTVKSVRTVRDAKDIEELMDVGRISSDKCLDLIRNVRRFISAHKSDILESRIESVQLIMTTAIPGFLRKCKDKIESPTYVLLFTFLFHYLLIYIYYSEENIQEQINACQQLTSCLEEVISIIKDAKAVFDSTFMEQIYDEEDDLSRRLKDSLDKLKGMLAKLHSLPEPEEKDKIKSNIVDLAKNVTSDPDLLGQEEKANLINALKQGMSPLAKDFFTSQKKLNTMMVKRPKATLEQSVVCETGSKDLIEAAKDMLSALKGMSSAISEAPELK